MFCPMRRRTSRPNLHELADDTGQSKGIWHTKDLKPIMADDTLSLFFFSNISSCSNFRALQILSCFLFLRVGFFAVRAII